MLNGLRILYAELTVTGGNYRKNKHAERLLIKRPVMHCHMLSLQLQVEMC
jgi:hypothetical protein